jgi:hypothetical protein
MSDITVINDSEQSSLVTNGLAKNGELYLKAAGSTDAGAIVVYDSGSWRTFANEASAGFANTYSLDFDGTNDYADLDSTISSTGAGSISMWINYDHDPSHTFFYLFSASQPLIYIDSSQERIYYGGNSAIGSLPKEQWNHLVWTRDSSNGYKIYVNGGSNIIRTGTDTNAMSLGHLFRHTNGSLGYNGKIDEIGVWTSTELSAGQVTAIYNSGIPDDLTSFSPTHWWRGGDSNGGSGSDITDVIAGNDMTLSNASIVPSVPS